MEKTKLFKKDFIAILKGMVEATDVENKAELLEFLDKENAALVRKASKPTKAQLANVPVKEAILEVLRVAGKPMLVKEIVTAVAEKDLAVEVTPNRVTALLTQLKEAGLVVRTEDKKKIFYSIAD